MAHNKFWNGSSVHKLWDINLLQIITGRLTNNAEYKLLVWFYLQLNVLQYFANKV